MVHGIVRDAFERAPPRGPFTFSTCLPFPHHPPQHNLQAPSPPEFTRKSVNIHSTPGYTLSVAKSCKFHTDLTHHRSKRSEKEKKKRCSRFPLDPPNESQPNHRCNPQQTRSTQPAGGRWENAPKQAGTGQVVPIPGR